MGPLALDMRRIAAYYMIGESRYLEAGIDRQGAIVWEGDAKANDILLPVEGLAIAGKNRVSDGICSSPEFELDGTGGGRREGQSRLSVQWIIGGTIEIYYLWE